jgi:hypothetical protein
MQRAAATRGTDATAAEAIERLKAFRREAVGAVRVGATGPLWTAMREEEAADGALAQARRMHADYLDREARLEEVSQAHLTAQARLAAAEAAVARREAHEVTGRAARATALTAAHPVAPAALATRDELADEVAAAIEAWRRRPAPVAALQGPSATELQAQLAALPAVPDGDRRPDRSVLDAARSLDLADEALRLYREAPPQEVVSPPPTRGQAPGRLPLLVAGVAAGAGLVLVALGQPLAGLGLVGTALLVGAWVAYAGRSRPSQGTSVQLIAGWQARSEQLLEAAHLAADGLRAALIARGANVDGDVRAAALAYEAACAEREDLARAAAASDGLRRAIEARSAAEEGAVRAADAARTIEASLREAAKQIGAHEDASLESLAASLVAWQGQRAEHARSSEVAIREWQELQGLLAGRTLAELQAEAARRAEAAESVASAAEPARVAANVDTGTLVAAARAETSAAKEAVDALTGELRLLATTLPDVAEAEERAETAHADMARVQDLAAVIDETLSLLEAAERRVHRDLAPILTESVQRHLAAITGGAYTEVGMNPRDLSVDVKEARTGQWRDARLLSEGTREQIYLLLRVAMAEHLVTTDERAPLLLDEVTAQSDPERKRRMLDVLHALSADRQVILFSHDAEVVEWASQALREPRDRLVRLAAPAVNPLAEAASR